MSGYVPCACRDCMEIAISNDPVRMEVWDEEAEEWIKYEETPPALCWECEKAECGLPDPEDTMGYECQRDDAYGANGFEAFYPEVHNNHPES